MQYAAEQQEVGMSMNKYNLIVIYHGHEIAYTSSFPIVTCCKKASNPIQGRS